MTNKKTPAKPEKTTHYREADKGLYVTKEFADKHPKTTIKETDKKKK